ncbi:nitroreductase/quinone reductase family protein [Streptosporangium sp. NBC_01756]|uniref:nitroreductase/quinone reductase family protein n=1 Tax=Streptosporangium sp. NBC_01756 TaxID=2975950 RepID=UPI002DDC0498|nr:nitroreductase/quinone reductase family protein [Streptosporangium sp. NBC_01756]WSC86603.1 nitroreductase/quinone reductase family protein [Streptosporangium sp. NBC_01756]
MLDGLGGNTAVQFVGGRLRLEKLGPLAEPPLMKELRNLVDGMLPRLDFPELLLEVFDRTGLSADFTHVSGTDAAMDDFPMSLAALIVAEACNVGLVPIEKPNVPALTRARLLQVDQGYLRAETISVANARLISAQAGLDIVKTWGGGQIASADGLRFVVSVQNLHTGHNPTYFGRQRGAIWLNVVNDQVMGIGGLVVPGALRDSLFILDAIHNLDGGDKPETVVTDTASYSDIVFGLFAICGYQFSPRIADLGDTRLWCTNTRAVCGTVCTWTPPCNTCVIRRRAMVGVVETVMVHLIGGVNSTVFHIAGGRVVLYRFRGLPGLLLTVIGSRTPRLRTVMVPFLRDGDDYIVLADRDTAGRPGWAAELLAVEPTDVVTVEVEGRSFDVDVARLDQADHAAMLDRHLKYLSLGERHEVRRWRQIPFVRLTALSVR